MLNNSKLRIAVLFGGQSGEHEVSLNSAQSVLSAIDQNRYTIQTIGISQQGQWFWGITPHEVQNTGFPANGKPVTLVHDPTNPHFLALDGSSLEDNGAVDLIFPVLHGPFGEDGTLQGLLEMAGIPYVGSGVLGAALGMDKDRMKAVFAQAGLRIARHLTFLRSEYEADAASILLTIEEKLGYPCFVKPANLGSSVGISKAKNRMELQTALTTAAIYDRKIIIEENINGREIEVSVLGNDRPIASVPGEIMPSRDFYDYESKYIDSDSRLEIPAKISSSVQTELQKAAIAAFRAVEAFGLSRVDFFVTPDEQIYLNEINTLPGFTKISMYPKLWEATGIPYKALIDELVSLGLERFFASRQRKISK